MTVVFGVDAGHVVPRGSGCVPARAEEVYHHPQGATARVTLEVSLGAAASRSAEAVSCEVAVDPGCPPGRGTEVDVVFHPDRMHVFEATGALFHAIQNAKKEHR